MRSIHRFTIVSAAAAGLVAAALPSVSYASFASRLGGSYGGTLSTNTTIKSQQLTADPASIAIGSMSTEYDPTLVTLSDLFPGPFFDISALIGVRLPGDPVDAERFITDDAYFNDPPVSFVETGYLQVTFIRKDDTVSQSIIDPLPGYIIVDSDGFLDGDDTHAMLFSAIAGADPNAQPVYRLYAEDGTNHDVLPDYLTNLDGDTVFEITDATVQGPIPEPGAGVLMLGALGLALTRRVRRHSTPA